MSRHPRRQDGTDPEAGALARWSERKARAREAGIQHSAEDISGVGSDRGDDDQPSKRDEDMPPVDALDENSDVSDFFSPEVSEKLRKAALRKFFHSPGFNIVDGLDDYDDDFTSFPALGDIVTAEMRHRMQHQVQERQETKDGEETGVAADDQNAEDFDEAGLADSPVESDGTDPQPVEAENASKNEADEMNRNRDDDVG
jgi:hypothetical protein